MKKSMFLCSLLLMLSSQAVANGALAIDSNQGQYYGFAYDYASMGEAQNRALQECGQGCRIVHSFSSGCAAYAADQAHGSTAYGWGTASTSGQAQSLAMSYCRNQGGGQCIVRVWGCNSN